MTELSIREARADDLSLIVAHNCAMAKETEDKDLDRAVLEIGCRAVLQDRGKGLYLLAEREGAVVGQLMVTFEWSDWRNGNFWWIQSVYVAPGARRRGVYRGLYAHLLEEARRRPDVCGVRLYVDKNNHSAQSTYEALGMGRAHYELYELDFVL